MPGDPFVADPRAAVPLPTCCPLRTAFDEAFGVAVCSEAFAARAAPLGATRGRVLAVDVLFLPSFGTLLLFLPAFLPLFAPLVFGILSRHALRHRFQRVSSHS